MLDYRHVPGLHRVHHFLDWLHRLLLTQHHLPGSLEVNWKVVIWVVSLRFAMFANNSVQ